MTTRNKQLLALTLCASTVASAWVLPSVGWVWAGLASLLGVALASAALHRPPLTAKLLLIPLLAWNFLMLGAASRLLSTAFPDGNEGTGLILLLVAVYAAGRGEKVVLRVGAVAVFLITILYGILVGFSLPSADASSAGLGGTENWPILVAALSPMLLSFLRREETRLGTWGLTIPGLALLCAVVTGENRNFYTAMKSVSVFGVIERLEPLASVAACIGGFCLMAEVCAVNERIGEKIMRRKVIVTPMNFFLGGACFWLSALVPDAVMAVGTAIFWGLIPFFPQGIEISKKFEKNEKSA